MKYAGHGSAPGYMVWMSQQLCCCGLRLQAWFAGGTHCVQDKQFAPWLSRASSAVLCTMYCLLQYTATVSWDSLPLLLFKKGPFSFPMPGQQTHLMLRSTACLESSQARATP